MDYLNPFSAMETTPDSVSPLLANMDRGQKANMALPFMQMMQQKQQQELQKSQMENQEFMSPMAQQARQLKIQSEAATNNANILSAPVKAEKDVAQYKADLEAMPHMTAQKIEEAKAAAIAARGKPIQGLFDEVSAANRAINKFPKGARQIAADQFIQSLKQRHPGQEIPPVLQRYDPSIWSMMEYASVYNAEHTRKMEEETLKQTEHMKRTEKEIAGRADVARIGAEGRRDVASMRGTGAEKPPKNYFEAVHIYKGIIDDPEAPEAQKETAKAQLRMAVEGQINKETSQYGLDIIKDSKKIEQIRKDRYKELGITAGETPKPSSQLKPGSKMPDGRTIEKMSSRGNPVVRNAQGALVELVPN